MKRSAIVLVTIWLFSVAHAETLHGTVVGVSDGDTLTVYDRSKNGAFRVRLAEIDAPEKAQPFGQRAKQALSGLCYRKEARVETTQKDRYGRVIGHVWCNGVNANKEMVKQGMAWVYRHYAKDEHLVLLEEAARHARIGLWRDNNPMPPWEWRKNERKTKN